MRYRGLDLNLLIALEALLNDRSVSLAALRVNRSQSAMSGSLARLREHFQDEILISTGHRMTLTAFGESIVEPIRDLMNHIQRTVEVTGTFDPATSNRLFTLCVSDYLIQFIMPDIARKVAELSPGTILDLIPATRTSYELLESRKVDLLVAASFSASDAYPFETLQQNDHAVLGWSGNPGLQNEQLTEEEFFRLGRVAGRFGARRMFSVAETHVQRIGGRQQIEVMVHSVEAIPSFLIGTNRIALMHRTIAEAFAELQPLVVRDPPFEFPLHSIVLQNHPNRSGDAGLEWLKELIRQRFMVDDA